MADVSKVIRGGDRPPLIVTYAKKTAETMVYGGSSIAALTFFIAFLTGTPFLVILGIAAACIAYFYSPYLRKDDPPMVIENRGIYVSGIGLIGWDAIEEVAYKTFAVRTLLNPTLIITLRRPLPTGLVEQDEPSFPNRFLAKCWRMEKEKTIKVPLQPFEQPHDTIIEAVDRRMEVV